MKCNKCEIDKKKEDFSLKNRVCKKCRADIAKENYKKNPNKQKNANQKYKNKFTEEEFKKINRQCKKVHYQKNKEKIINKNKQWRNKNPGYQKNYEKNRRLNDIEFRITGSLRSRLSQAVKYQYAIKQSTKELLGCDVSFLRTHLENKFKSGMSWKNYGEWHIDHIKACANFNLKDVEQQKECFNYKNLQPLWAEENIRKSNKINW